MKRLGLMLLTLALLVCGTASAYNPYAPNPFDAIEQNSWEYKYLLDLTKAGLTGADMARFSPSYALTYARDGETLKTETEKPAGDPFDWKQGDKTK